MEFTYDWYYNIIKLLIEKGYQFISYEDYENNYDVKKKCSILIKVSFQCNNVNLNKTDNI